MEHKTYRPGDVLPDHQGVQATAQISATVQGMAAEMIAMLTPDIGVQEALNAVFSGVLSAAVNLGIKTGAQESTARNLMWAACQVMPTRSNDKNYQLANIFVGLANVLHSIGGTPHKPLVVGMLNAAANAAFSDRDWLIAQLRTLADRMGDPAEIAAAEAQAELMLRPADTRIQ
jgi:hypothetical protein